MIGVQEFNKIPLGRPDDYLQSVFSNESQYPQPFRLRNSNGSPDQGITALGADIKDDDVKMLARIEEWALEEWLPLIGM